MQATAVTRLCLCVISDAARSSGTSESDAPGAPKPRSEGPLLAERPLRESLDARGAPPSMDSST